MKIKSRFKVTVTANNIKIGYYESGHVLNCPIALALRRQFPKENVSCGFNTLTVGSRRFKVPEAGKKFQSDMFAGKKVKPFSFTVRAIPWW